MHSLLIIDPVAGQVQRDQAAVVLQLLDVSSAFQLVACTV